jgi:hypothetical protein
MSEATEMDDEYWYRVERERQQRFFSIVAMLKQGLLTMDKLSEEERQLLQEYRISLPVIPGGKSDGQK